MNYFTMAARIVRALAVALWVGAMAGFAFIFAPIAFHIIGPTPAFAATIASTVHSIAVLGWICALAAAAATFALPERTWWGSMTFLAAIAVMSALSFFEVSSVVPQMQRTPLQTPAYDALHRESSRVYGTALLLGIFSLALISMRDEGVAGKPERP